MPDFRPDEQYFSPLRMMVGSQELVFKYKITVKKSEKPKFKVFEPKVRRNETPQIVFHCVNEGFGMSAYVTKCK